MSAPDARAPRAVRIDVGTSEIDGGACRSWADPIEVLGAVALSSPEDSFARFVSPRLSAPLDPKQAVSGDLPLPLRIFLGRLQAIHADLYRENRSLQREPRWVELTCLAAEEDRVYVVKTAPAWIAVLRDGHALLADRPSAGPRERSGLGTSETLHLEVSSLPVQPGDIVVMLCADSDVKPDIHAVVRMFEQTTDMKRACDGLVNLLGLQSASGSAVALRFIPIASAAGSEANPLVDLIPGLIPPAEAGAMGASATSVPPAARIEEDAFVGWFDDEKAPVERPAWAPENGKSSPMASGPPHPTAAHGASAESREFEEWQFPWESGEAGDASDPPTATPPMDAAPSPPVESPGHAGAPVVTPTSMPVMPTMPETPSPVAAETQPVPEPEFEMAGAGAPSDGHGRPGFAEGLGSRRVAWLAIVAGAVCLVGLAMAVPKLRLGTGGSSVSKAQIWVEPNPPAARVFVDGAEAGGKTPLRLTDLKQGHRVISLDYGIAGRYEAALEVGRSGSLRFAPRVRGTLRVHAMDASSNGMAWVQGRPKTNLPATLDSLAPGWVRLFFEDEHTPLFERAVLVRADGAVDVSIPNHRSGEDSAIQIEAMHLDPAKGLIASETDSVFVDDEFVGLTPADLPMWPGLHSVRVEAGRGRAHTEILDLRPGTQRVLIAKFDATSEPQVTHAAPGRVVIEGPLALSVEILNPADLPLTNPTLHFPELSGEFRELPLQTAGEGGRTFVGVVPPDAFREASRNAASRTISTPYYFSVAGPGQAQYFSDLYRLEARLELGGSSARTRSVQAPPVTPESPEETPEPVAIPLPDEPTEP